MLIALQLVATPQGVVVGEAVRAFRDEQVTIGRAPNCHVVLPDGLRVVSRQHARLTRHDGEVLLTCLSASAPVHVNAVLVPHGGALPVRVGDALHIGGFQLRVCTHAEAAAPERMALAPRAASVKVPSAEDAESPRAAGAIEPEVSPAAGAAAAPHPRARARLDEWFDLSPAVASAVPPAAALADARADAPADPDVSVAWATTDNVDLDLRSGAYGASAAPPVASAAASAVQEPVAGPPLNDETLRVLMQAFLDGAGLAARAGATSTQVLAPMALTPAWMRHIGELLRASVDGAMALLHSRSTVKREMRAEVTVIARRQNNPLKFAPDAPAALAHLVAAKRSPGFLEPVAAVKDAHEDLLVHHLAVVAGMRAAMFELIARLGPDDVLRDEGPAKGLAATLPTLQEAALWRRYRQRHAEMTASLDDDFEAVFGREFTKAYEAQARRVREQAPPEGTAP